MKVAKSDTQQKFATEVTCKVMQSSLNENFSSILGKRIIRDGENGGLFLMART